MDSVIFIYHQEMDLQSIKGCGVFFSSRILIEQIVKNLKLYSGGITTCNNLPA